MSILFLSAHEHIHIRMYIYTASKVRYTQICFSYKVSNFYKTVNRGKNNSIIPNINKRKTKNRKNNNVNFQRKLLINYIDKVMQKIIYATWLRGKVNRRRPKF